LLQGSDVTFDDIVHGRYLIILCYKYTVSCDGFHAVHDHVFFLFPQAQVKQREGEVTQMQMELATIERSREALAAEVAR